MGQVQDEAKKLLQAFYDDWCVNLQNYVRAKILENFGDKVGDEKAVIRARTYLVDKGYLEELPRQQDNMFRMHQKGIDAIENGTF